MRARRVWGVALSSGAHAAPALIAWRGTAPMPMPTPPAAALSVRMIERAPRLAIAATSDSPREAVDQARALARLADPPATRRAAAIAPAPAPARESVAATRADDSAATHPPRSEAQAETRPLLSDAVVGVGFGPPRIGYAVGTPPRAWFGPGQASSQRAEPMPANPQEVALRQREASRGQLIAALERRVDELPPPLGSGDGSCALHPQPEQPRLDCDSDALHDAVRPQAAALSGLLQAWRSINSEADGLSIAFSQGRYRVSLAMADSAR